MNKMKELMEKIITFIKARKGYCIVAAALIVLLILVVPRLNIETAKQHDDRKNQETKKRQELLAELEESEVEDSDSMENVSGDGVVSGEAGSTGEADAQSNVSGQGIVSADGSNGEMGAAAGMQSQADNMNQNLSQSADQNQTDNQNQSQTSSQTQTGNQNQSQSTSQNHSQNTAQTQANNQSQSQSTNQTQSGNQNQSNNQNQSQSTNQTQTGSQNQSQSTNQNQTTNENQSQGNASSNQEEYIIVIVKIVCDSVLNNPELSTSATLPSDGVIIEAKTAVKKGESVFDALKAVCTDHGITYTSRGPDSSAYVTSIGGLAEKECGKYSGWKYKVNGTVSGKSSGTHKLNQNDVVEWYYTTSINQ